MSKHQLKGSSREPRIVRPALTALGLSALCLLHFALILDMQRRQTPTFDEVAHLPAGLAYLQKSSLKVYRLSPPLARWVAALPASWAKPRLDFEGTWKLHDPPNHWAFAYGAIAMARGDEELEGRYLRSFTLARSAIALWSTATIPILFAWAAGRVGPPAAWLASVLWALCPNVIAHAGLVTTDLAAASMAVAACFAFGRWCECPTWRRALLAGCVLGLAQLVKFTLLWLCPILPLGAGIVLWRRRALSWNVGAQLLTIGLACLATIDVGYLGQGIGTPLGQFPFACRALTRDRQAADGPIDRSWNAGRNKAFQTRVNRWRNDWLGSLPCPLPYDYVAGFDEQMFEAEAPARGYLLGEWFGDPDNPSALRQAVYYPAALLLKLPLGSLGLIAVSVIAIWRMPPGTRDMALAWWLLALLPLLAAGLGTRSCLGVRYVLPALPFLFLAMGCLASTTHSRLGQLGLFAAVAVNALSLCSIHPHELSYFNALAGGPRNGRRLLIDSNLDWGQDLRSLSRWLATNSDWQSLRLAYAGSVPAEFEGLRALPAPRDLRRLNAAELLPWEDLKDPTTYGPQPGKFAVSVNFERGMAYQTPLPVEVPRRGGGVLRQKLTVADPVVLYMPRDVWAYFQCFEPRIDPAVGYSILLYDLKLDEVNAVRRRMGIAELSH